MVMKNFESCCSTELLTDPPSRAAHAARQIIQTLLQGYQGKVAVRLWDERLAVGRGRAECTLHVRSPEVVKRLVVGHDLCTLVEDYLDGRLEVEGEFESLFDTARHFETLQLSRRDKLRLFRLALKLPGPLLRFQAPAGRQENGCESITRHYDVGNDFYQFWLDPQMVYSCAYFADTNQSLEQAQRDKLDYICRKLQLQPEQSLLDIGCGWGGLACWAARRYGVLVHGFTLSEQQWRFANEKIKHEGLADRVTIELRDYRELDGESVYDRIVSVGMFEHIGLANFPDYFGRIKRMLRPGGIFLNHGITSDQPWGRSQLNRFINRYIFPDGELTRISDVLDAMEQAGLEVVDVEGLRRHYAMTLRHWVSALEAQSAEVIAAVGVKTYRLWRLYMAGCAHYFDRGSIGIYQAQAARQQDENYRQPLRRDYLYLPDRASVARE